MVSYCPPVQYCTIQASIPDVYRGKYQNPGTAGEQYAGEIQSIVEQQRQPQGTGIASFIHESVMCSAGMIYFPEGFLQAAYKSVHAV